MRKPIEESAWAGAGERTRSLLMDRAYPDTTQKAVAAALNISDSSLSRILRGKRPLSEQSASHIDQLLTKRADSKLVANFTYAPHEILEIWYPEAAPPSQEPVTGDIDPTKTEPPTSITVLTGGVILTLLVIGALVFAWPSGDSAEADSDSNLDSSLTGCTIALAGLEPELASQYRSWKDRMINEYIQVRPDYDGLCPVELVHEGLGGQVLIQKMVDNQGRQMVLLAADEANAIALNKAQWNSLLEVRRIPEYENLFPLRFKVGVEGSSITMNDSSEMVAPEPTLRHVLVDSEVLKQWRSDGGPGGFFGWPASHGYREEGRRRYDFEGGRYLLEPSSEGKMTVIAVRERPRGLPQGKAPRLLSLPDGSLWLVNEEGRRFWIDDPTVRSCLVRSLPPAVQTNGTAMANLPLGQNPTCL